MATFLAFASALAAIGANPVANPSFASHNGYHAHDLYIEVFATEEEARTSQGVNLASVAQETGRTLFLIHNNDSDNMVVVAQFGSTESEDDTRHENLHLVPGGWGVVGNIQKGISRRFSAHPGCDINFHNCMPNYDRVTLFEYTDGGDRMNVEASINLSLGI
jgi:hypothetical protein